ncbi:hypothetical protein PROAA_470005 [Candidatus Propionivibrio aalborgensis]|uniref:Uncharacterized protein n=1 Tax=Candidatus Propionivibrio aalborgensis TaxID=1860101 RepID=A0A1A8XZR5_9RHOO|nr:hypothetical protein PROAA_470005 [Candidatus Propionivibrio aalborgensis]
MISKIEPNCHRGGRAIKRRIPICRARYGVSEPFAPNNNPNPLVPIPPLARRFVGFATRHLPTSYIKSMY